MCGLVRGVKFKIESLFNGFACFRLLSPNWFVESLGSLPSTLPRRVRQNERLTRHYNWRVDDFTDHHRVNAAVIDIDYATLYKSDGIHN